MARLLSQPLARRACFPVFFNDNQRFFAAVGVIGFAVFEAFLLPGLHRLPNCPQSTVGQNLTGPGAPRILAPMILTFCRGPGCPPVSWRPKLYRPPVLARRLTVQPPCREPRLILNAGQGIGRELVFVHVLNAEFRGTGSLFSSTSRGPFSILHNRLLV